MMLPHVLLAHGDIGDTHTRACFLISLTSLDTLQVYGMAAGFKYLA